MQKHTIKRNEVEKMHLVGTEFLEEIIETSIYSSRLEGEQPVSLLLVAESGAGKSKTLLRFHAEFIYRCDDLTSMGLFNLLEQDKKNNLSFMLLPDLNPALSHRGSVSNLLMANLLTVTADGTMAIADGRAQKIIKHRPIGLISAVTSDMFYASHKKWKKLGLLRRFLAIHYTYSTETVAAAMKEISKGKINGGQLTPIKIENKQYKPAVINDTIKLQLESLSKDLAANLAQYISYSVPGFKDNNRRSERKTFVSFGKPTLPMSPHVILRTMCAAHAVRAKRTVINDEDIQFVTKMIQFTGMAQPAQI